MPLGGSMLKKIKLTHLVAILAMLLLASCAASILTGKINHLVNFSDSSLNHGQGAVLMHATNQGGLIATRWFRIDNPERKYSFTVYRTDRHRAIDSMNLYDVVTVEPGTYVLYSVFSNCESGMRPGSTEWDEPMRENVATSLGMVSWLRSFKPGSSLTSGVGIWGGNGGMNDSIRGSDMAAAGVGPGTPVAICNLRSPGMSHGQPALATITVNPGELVYAGEININYATTNTCETIGNWLTDNEARQYCGADRVTLRIRDEFQSKALPFIEKYLGAEAASKAVVRLAEPGVLVSTQ